MGLTDQFGPRFWKLPAKALNLKNIALTSKSSGANVNSSDNNVNKASSSSTVDDCIVSRNSSRSVVPTAAVLAAELLKRTAPPSIVGVPKYRKKL